VPIPRMTNKHWVTCSLCGYTEEFDSVKGAAFAADQHLRAKHAVRPYASSKQQRTVTVLFAAGEGISPEGTDPFNQFSKWYSWFTDHQEEMDATPDS
jgi:hypothetical protein